MNFSGLDKRYRIYRRRTENVSCSMSKVRVDDVSSKENRGPKAALSWTVILLHPMVLYRNK
jgi:hypothetical protein